MNGIKDLAQKRSQFAYGCVDNVFCFKNEKNIFRTFLENKLAQSKEKDKTKKEIEIQNKKNDIEKFLNNQTNFQHLTKEELEKAQKSFGKDYQSYVKKIPMRILTNGLGATFAFVYSKKKDGNAYDLIYKQTKEWLKVPKNDELVKWIIDRESPEYRAVTNEVLALFNWLKRFADGMIEGEETNGD
jgi:CRISPR-associated protein Cmr5